MSINDSITHGHDKLTTVITGNRVRRSMSSGESRRREVTGADVICASRSVHRRLKKLGRCRLRAGHGERTVHETKWNADAFETPTLLDDEVRQRGMTVPGHEDICKPERFFKFFKFKFKFKSNCR